MSSGLIPCAMKIGVCFIAFGAGEGFLPGYLIAFNSVQYPWQDSPPMPDRGSKEVISDPPGGESRDRSTFRMPRGEASGVSGGAKREWIIRNVRTNPSSETGYAARRCKELTHCLTLESRCVEA